MDNLGGDGELYLLFSAGGSKYAIPFGSCAEVIETPEISLLPVKSSVYIGAMNFHNKILALVSLENLITGGGERKKSAAVVIALSSGKSGLAIGVDKVHRVAKSVSLRDESACAMISGVVEFDDGVAYLLDAEKLVEKAGELLN